MTEKAELDRVRAIHSALDNWAAGDLRRATSFWIEHEGCERVTFTVDEVRAWPETKAKLRKALIDSSYHRCHALAVWRPGWDGCFGSEVHVTGEWEDNPPVRANGARGLCLYREMLDDVQPEPALPTGHPAPGSTGLRLNEEQRKALKVKPCTLPGGSHSLDHLSECCSICGMRTEDVLRQEAFTVRGIDPASDATPEFKANCHRFNDEQIAALTVALPANVEARKRQVDRLRREMDEGESRRAALVGLVHPVTNRALGRMR